MAQAAVPKSKIWGSLVENEPKKQHAFLTNSIYVAINLIHSFILSLF